MKRCHLISLNKLVNHSGSFHDADDVALLAAVFVGTDDDNVLAPANVICPNEWVINFFDNEFWGHSGISCMCLVLKMSGKKTTKTISPSIYIL